MGMFNRFEIGLHEKASRIAVKHGVTFDTKTGEFKGLEDRCDRAERELKEWKEREEWKRRMDRQW